MKKLANDNAPKFWHMHASGKAGNEALRLMKGKSPKLAFQNKYEIISYISSYQFFYGPGPTRIPQLESCPTPIFKSSAKSFSPSIVFSNPDLYSKRFRDALNLSRKEIQYIDIDFSESTDLFIENDYKMAHILCVGDVFDLEASGFEQYDTLDEGGGNIVGWRPKTANGIPIIGAIRFVFRENPSIPSGLFYSRWTGQLMATDELAESVIQSGIDDVHFQDVTFVDPEHKLVRLKSADGIHIVDYESFCK